jgi:uncharacterized membrane protein YdjX (TVP38/TMEM64 family)
MVETAPLTALALQRFWRMLPLGLLGLAMIGVYASGLADYISLHSIVAHHDAVAGFVHDNMLVAVLIYMMVYISAVSLSLPGAALLSILGGFLFGWMLSALVSAIAATAGAVIVFLVVRTSLGSAMATAAGPYARKLSDGFHRDAFSYLLSLRLAPVVPFFAVNAVAGLAGVKLKTFVLATIIGIVPGAIAYAWVGRGFEGVVAQQAVAHSACLAAHPAAACETDISILNLLPAQVLLAFGGLAVLALVPLALKWWRAVV